MNSSYLADIKDESESLMVQQEPRGVCAGAAFPSQVARTL